jgi:LacI family transcriptional regulator
MTETKQPTLHDVARYTGISKSTISRVLNNAPNVSAETRRVVTEAISALGYRANNAARALRTNTTRNVGFVVASLRNEVFAGIAEGMEGVLNDRNQTLLVAITHEDPANEVEVIRSLIARGVDGLVISLADERSTALTALRRAHVPTIVLDRDVRGNFADLIFTDHHQAIHDAVEDLVTHGHQRISLLCSTLALRPGREVKSAFVDVLPDSTDLIVAGPLTEEFGIEAVGKVLSDPNPPSAMIISGTEVLVGALGIFAQRGLRIPEDISVVAYDDSDASRIHRPPISVILRDNRETGRLAGQLIVERLERTRTEQRKIVIPARYTPRASVAARAGSS